jgi:hypothetical protein
VDKPDKPAIDQERLVKAWRKTLPDWLNQTDRAQVLKDEKIPNGLRIHIDTAGHSAYAFDFRVQYLDSREIKVELADVTRDHQPVNEHNEQIQQLIEDYVRHLHECAQALHELTHS